MRENQLPGIDGILIEARRSQLTRDFTSVNPSFMTVRLRLAVHGVRNNRIFHLVAIDQRKRRNAKPIELLGIYRPRVEPKSPHKSVEWSVDRIKYWLGVGAQPSDSVVKLLTTVCLVRLGLVPFSCSEVRLGKQGRVIPPDSKWHSKPTLQFQHQQNTSPALSQP